MTHFLNVDLPIRAKLRISDFLFFFFVCVTWEREQTKKFACVYDRVHLCQFPVNLFFPRGVTCTSTCHLARHGKRVIMSIHLI